jgi:tRNA threonylcarbamoyladenosine biosynthesis protein TsaB
MILCLETATNLCSAALIESAGVVSVRESEASKSHASMLTVFIGELLREQGMMAVDLQAVAVSKGPGSYSGLRIAVSAAKGIAYGASIPLIGIETTLSMFHGIIEHAHSLSSGADTLFCPMLDARRMEVYFALYNLAGFKIKDITAEVINENSFSDILDIQSVIFFGEGALKCRDVIRHKNAIFAENFSISASHMQKPVIEAFNNNAFEDVAYFEPLYLKDFITSTPKRNILGK